MTLPPWVYGPFELLLHAELHYREGGEFDRRIALISFDNAIEVAVSTFLSLHPLQRGKEEYDGAKVQHWLRSFPNKLEFIEHRCGNQKITPAVSSADMIYYHNIRNDQYHEGKATIPTWETLSGIRSAALWVFNFLYNVPDIESRIETRIRSLTPEVDIPKRDDELDKFIDTKYGVVWFGETSIYASDLLFAYDPIAYRNIGIEAKQIKLQGGDGDE
ncbi:hypothetical protein [Deinococcus planocerae]|uniref:hypothetical protein n=1 Tax=Deinococcus planocerae TaxID=1737569 RepID=UPI0011AEF685|nr:hypothetical protein [Deinococcus planocerae]